MCGRYQVSTEEEIIEIREIIGEVNDRYKDKPLLASVTTGEVFPTNIAPILVAGKSKPQAALMKWGFPKYQGSGVIINARTETAIEKRMFYKPLLERRCVIPTTGFYEWRQEESRKKTKFHFRTDEMKALYLAGLYGSFYDGNAAYDAYVILTTAANPSMTIYHDRMPLILNSSSIDDWLSDTEYALDYIKKTCETMLHAKAV